MTESSSGKAHSGSGGLSRLDMAVGVLAVLLIAGTLLVAILSDPGRQGPAVAYIHPYGGGVPNIWLASLEDPLAAQQLTDEPIGVFDFDVSNDGRLLAYSARPQDSLFHEIYLLNLQTRDIQQVTDCTGAEADCTAPDFRPGDDVLAFVRIDTNMSLEGVGPGTYRIWLADIRQSPMVIQPLTPNSQVVGHSPDWAHDGRSLLFYSADIANPGTNIFNYAPVQGDPALIFVPGNSGDPGTLSPDGNQLVYPEYTRRDDGNVYRHLRIADLASRESRPLTGPDGLADDAAAHFSPDGSALVVERRYIDGPQATTGYQLYRLDLATEAVTPLLVDGQFQHGFAVWNTTGDKVAFQRLQLSNADGQPAVGAQPEVWALDSDGRPIQVAVNAFMPRWVRP